eukprot:COSAG02_NODE_1720_length_11195_cov_7.064978_3_plen_121_part_00
MVYVRAPGQCLEQRACYETAIYLYLFNTKLCKTAPKLVPGKTVKTIKLNADILSFAATLYWMPDCSPLRLLLLSLRGPLSSAHCLHEPRCCDKSDSPVCSSGSDILPDTPDHRAKATHWC